MNLPLVFAVKLVWKWWEEVKNIEFLKLYQWWVKVVVTKLPEHTVKKNVGWGGVLGEKHHSFLNSEPGRDEKTPLSPCWLTTEGRTPYYHYLNYIWKFTSYCTLSCLQRKINGLVLFRERMAVCCSNCRNKIHEDFVTICCLMLQCVAHSV